MGRKLNGAAKSAQCFFRFLDLPSELQFRILAFILPTDSTVDRQTLGTPRTLQRLKLCLVCKRVRDLAVRLFYSQNSFRIFPTTGHNFSKTVPLLRLLPEKYRFLITSLELRLGPGWGSPSPMWRVDDRLGLEAMSNVWLLKIYIEIDPSQDMFTGFRAGKNFYTEFSRKLLRELMKRLPALQQIRLDGRPSVMSKGAKLMSVLVQQARSNPAILVCVPVCSARDTLVDSFNGLQLQNQDSELEQD